VGEGTRGDKLDRTENPSFKWRKKERKLQNGISHSHTSRDWGKEGESFRGGEMVWSGVKTPGKREKVRTKLDRGHHQGGKVNRVLLGFGWQGRDGS